MWFMFCESLISPGTVVATEWRCNVCKKIYVKILIMIVMIQEKLCEWLLVITRDYNKQLTVEILIQRGAVVFYVKLWHVAMSGQCNNNGREFFRQFTWTM